MFQEGELVWVKMDGQPWWPAVVAGYRDNQKAKVLFLEENLKANIPLTKIRKYHLSQRRLRHGGGKANPQLEQALLLAQQYYRDHHQTWQSISPLEEFKKRGKAESRQPNQTASVTKSTLSKPPPSPQATEPRKDQWSTTPRANPASSELLFRSHAKTTQKGEVLQASNLRRSENTLPKVLEQKQASLSRQQLASQVQEALRISMDTFSLRAKLTEDQRKIAQTLLSLLIQYADHPQILLVVLQQNSEWDKSLKLYYRSEFRTLFENYERQDITTVKTFMLGLLRECVDGVVFKEILNLLNASTDKANVEREKHEGKSP